MAKQSKRTPGRYCQMMASLQSQMPKQDFAVNTLEASFMFSLISNNLLNLIRQFTEILPEIIIAFLYKKKENNKPC